jgi:hypothetical protein
MTAKDVATSSVLSCLTTLLAVFAVLSTTGSVGPRVRIRRWTRNPVLSCDGRKPRPNLSLWQNWSKLDVDEPGGL